MLIVQIAIGVVVGVVLLVGLLWAWLKLLDYRNEIAIKRYAEDMERRGYEWFLDGWVKRRDD